MSDLIWLLAIGVLFFFMMRWGCGAGHGHDGGHKHGSDENREHPQHEHKSGGCH